MSTTANLWNFIPNAVTNIEDSPFTVPEHIRPEYVRLATDVNVFAKATDGRDFALNHDMAVRAFSKTLGLNVEERPEPGAPGLTRSRELTETEMGDRILATYGVAPRGVWAHVTALELATNTTRALRATNASNAQRDAASTCSICGETDTAHPPKIRRDAVRGDHVASHWRVASLATCDDCHLVLLHELTTKATNAKVKGGKTRQAVIGAFLAS